MDYIDADWRPAGAGCRQSKRRTGIFAAQRGHVKMAGRSAPPGTVYAADCTMFLGVSSSLSACQGGSSIFVVIAGTERPAYWAVIPHPSGTALGTISQCQAALRRGDRPLRTSLVLLCPKQLLSKLFGLSDRSITRLFAALAGEVFAGGRDP